MIAGRVLLLHPECYPLPKQSTVRLLGEVITPHSETMFFGRDHYRVFYHTIKLHQWTNGLGWAVS